MSMNMSNMVLLAMKQTAKGTPAAPVPGTHAILCRGLTPQPIKGKFVERKGVFILPTFHPAALLRDPAKKRDAWADLQLLRQKLNELAP